MDTYGIEWLFFQRKDHLKTIKKNVTRYIHPIFHTCNSKPKCKCEKNQIFAVNKNKSTEKKYKVIKNRDFYKVSKYIFINIKSKE